MSNAAKKDIHHNVDEEGVASGAASLGADGGPTGGAAPAAAEFDDAFEDDAWLDEELTDEELAALEDENIDVESLLDEASYDEDFDELSSDAFMEDELTEGELAALSAADEGIDLDQEASELAAVEKIQSFFNEEAAHTEQPESAFGGTEIEEDFSAEPSFDAVDDELGAFADEAGDELPPVADEPGFDDDAAQAGALVAADHGVPVDEFAGDYEEVSDADVDHRPVPRISIHAFCETPAITALIEKASVDRRISKAHLTMHMGGVAKAVDQFQTVATPNLIILEMSTGGSQMFAQLAELAEVCDPSTKVVIIGHVNDIILYRELIRQGISDYIVRPQSPLQIIKAIADLYVDPSAPPIGRTIAFVGARGGAGSSTLAHNVAWCVAEEFKSDTVLLDLDLPFGTASLDFDQEASAGLFEALNAPERLDDVLLDRLLQKHTEYLSLFTAPSVLDRDFDVDDQAYETVIDVVRGSAPTVIIDVPHIWSSWSKRLLTTADEIVVTATPDLASFRNTKQLVDILTAARPNDASPTLVVNQFDPKVSAVRPEQFAEHVGLTPKQVFNWEPQVYSAAATNAAPIIEVSPKSKTANGFRELAAQLVGRNEANVARPKFSLAGLFMKKG